MTIANFILILKQCKYFDCIIMMLNNSISLYIYFKFHAIISDRNLKSHGKAQMKTIIKQVKETINFIIFIKIVF